MALLAVSSLLVKHHFDKKTVRNTPYLVMYLAYMIYDLFTYEKSIGPLQTTREVLDDGRLKITTEVINAKTSCYRIFTKQN